MKEFLTSASILYLFKRTLVVLLFAISVQLSAQTYINQNGVQTSVINPISANATQARRFEVATIGYNSYHWQAGGLIIVELFQYTYGTGYEKYSVEVGYSQGAQGSPEVKLIDSQGKYHTAKVTLGTPYDLGTQHGGYVNKAMPIYVDVRDYAVYKVRVTYLRDKVNTITNMGQIKINDSPTPINIPDFTVSTNPNETRNLMVRGAGNHFIEKGYVGIGTTNPKTKLDVAGKIRATEVEVTVNAGADYVFDPDYTLKPLSEIEAFIKENKHLPEIQSEKQMKEEGLNMNEFQIKLLQKIEEITLYMIEQDKVIQEQNHIIKKLQEKIDITE